VEEIIQTAIAAGATSIGGIGLHLRGEVRGVFMEWLRAYRPDLVEHYEALYSRGGYLPRAEQDRDARLLRDAGAPERAPFRRDPAADRPFEREFRRQMGPRDRVDRSRGGAATGDRRMPVRPSAGIQEALF
jgi:hypothetical protein